VKTWRPSLHPPEGHGLNVERLRSETQHLDLRAEAKQMRAALQALPRVALADVRVGDYLYFPPPRSELGRAGKMTQGGRADVTSLIGGATVRYTPKTWPTDTRRIDAVTAAAVLDLNTRWKNRDAMNESTRESKESAVDPLVERAVGRIMGKASVFEASLYRFLQHFKHTPMAVLTAYIDEDTNAQNDPRNAQLAWVLWNRGFSFVPTRGTYTDTDATPPKVYEQPGFTVIGIGFADALEIAAQYFQKSFTWTDGEGSGMVYATGSGEPIEKPDWKRFHVFMDPSQVVGGMIPSRSKTKRRGFAITAGVAPIDVRFGATLPALVEGDLEEEPTYVLLPNRRKGGPGIAMGVRRYSLQLPLDELCLVEVDLPPSFRAHCNLPRVSMGVLAEGVYHFIRNDGTVSILNGIADYIIRWASLVAAPEP